MVATVVGSHHLVECDTNAGRPVHQCGDQQRQLAQTRNQMNATTMNVTTTTKVWKDVETDELVVVMDDEDEDELMMMAKKQEMKWQEEK